MATSVPPDYYRDLLGGEVDSSHLTLGIDDLRAITESLTKSSHTTLTDLATVARRKNTVTRVTLTVDIALAGQCFPIICVLFRNLIRVSALELTFANTSFGVDLGLVCPFLQCCLDGAARLTSISLYVREDMMPLGTLDWGFFRQCKNLRSFSLHNATMAARFPWAIDFCSMLKEVSALECLERVVIRGFQFTVSTDLTFARHFDLIMGFFSGRSLDTLELDSVPFNSEVVLPSLVSGLRSSSIKHLHLFYFCNSIDESSRLIMAIATCTEFRTISLEGGLSRPATSKHLPFFGGAILLQHARLTSLCLGQFAISDDEAWSMSLELVKRSCILEKLELSVCDMSYVAVGILLSSLTAHTSIRDVCIRGDVWARPVAAFDETVLVPVEKALETVASAPLTSLRLVEYYIEPRVSRARARTMAQCLRGNQHLETIEISYLDEDHQSLLDSIGRLNAAGRRHALASGSKKAGVELLGKVSSNVNDVFLHLCENPSLCVFEHAPP